MKLTQIRNATLTVEFAGKKILIDPMLARKGTYPGFEGTVNSHLANPLVELPVAVDTLLDVDAVIVTHTHADHWDDAAQKLIPKDMLVFAQHARDAALIRNAGFKNVRVLTENTYFENITLIKTFGQHGSDEALEQIGEILGDACGVVFKHPDEKTLYLAGDTVWNEYVIQNLEAYSPDVIILNTGDAQVIGLGSIIMGKEDVSHVCEAVPHSTIFTTHMEAINHCTLSRAELRQFIGEKGLTSRVLVPEDGETCTL